MVPSRSDRKRFLRFAALRSGISLESVTLLGGNQPAGTVTHHSLTTDAEASTERL